MQTKQNRPEYLEKRNKVIEYINNNLDEKILISELAKISNLSEFHFHRVIKSLLGESIGNYITRTRLETATLLIRYTNLEIKNIAYKVGYKKASSLNKRFKQYYNISPTEYRKNNTLKINHSIIKPSNFKLDKPQIVNISNKEVIYIRTTGEYGKDSFDEVWKELSNYMQKNKLFYLGIESFGISYDDPSVTKIDKCRYEACFTTNQKLKPQGNVGIKTIKGGDFAVFNYKGSNEKWEEIYNYIFDQWLINSSFELRNEPVMEKYLTPTNQNKKLHLEIYLPIKKIINLKIRNNEI